jgi:hypothetical protein
VRIFRHNLAHEEAIGSHAFALLEATMRVTNGIPLPCQLPLTVSTINHAETLTEGRIQLKWLSHRRDLLSLQSVEGTGRVFRQEFTPEDAI